MSNQNTEIQKTETKQSFIEKTASDTLSKTISILLSGGIIAVISILIAFVYGLPYFLYLPLGALAFCFVALGFYLFSFRPTNKLLKAEIESLKELKEETSELPLLPQAEIKKCKEDLDAEKIILEAEKQVALGDLTLEHQKALNWMQTNFDSELRQRDAVLDEVGFLLDTVRRHKDNIRGCVILEAIKYSEHDFEGHPFLKVVFVLRVFNKSFFDITFENKLGGEIKFNRQPFHGSNGFFEPPPTINSLEKDCIRIEQRLSRTDVDSIKEAIKKNEIERQNFIGSGFTEHPNTLQIEFYDLVITTKGSEKFPQVLPQRLNMHNLTVEVTKKEFNL